MVVCFSIRPFTSSTWGTTLICDCLIFDVSAVDPAHALPAPAQLMLERQAESTKQAFIHCTALYLDTEELPSRVGGHHLVRSQRGET